MDICVYFLLIFQMTMAIYRKISELYNINDIKDLQTIHQHYS